MKNLHLTVVGNIASGKTTACRILAESLNASLLDADTFEGNPFLPSYVADRQRWAFATELYFMNARIKKLANLKRLLKKGPVIVDSGLYMSHHVYVKNHFVQGTMTASEWDFFQELVTDMQKGRYANNSTILLLQCPVAVLFKRIAKRGRGFEKEYDATYLQQLEDRLSELQETLEKTRKKLLIFDSAKYDIQEENGKTELIKQIIKNFVS